MKIRLVKMLISYLNRNYPFLMREAVVPEYAHIAWNPGHKPQSGADKVLAEISRQKRCLDEIERLDKINRESTEGA